MGRAVSRQRMPRSMLNDTALGDTKEQRLAQRSADTAA